MTQQTNHMKYTRRLKEYRAVVEAAHALDTYLGQPWAQELTVEQTFDVVVGAALGGRDPGLALGEAVTPSRVPCITIAEGRLTMNNPTSDDRVVSWGFVGGLFYVSYREPDEGQSPRQVTAFLSLRRNVQGAWELRSDTKQTWPTSPIARRTMRDVLNVLGVKTEPPQLVDDLEVDLILSPAWRWENGIVLQGGGIVVETQPFRVVNYLGMVWDLTTDDVDLWLPDIEAPTTKGAMREMVVAASGDFAGATVFFSRSVGGWLVIVGTESQGSSHATEGEALAHAIIRLGREEETP